MSNIIQSSAMPQQQIPPLPPGATSIYNAGLIKSQEQINNQMALIGKTGGAPVVQVPSPPAGTLNPGLTSANYKDLTQLAQLQSQQAIYDSAKTPEQTARISATQNALYKGGKRRRRTNKRKRTKRRRTKRRTKRRKLT